MGLKDELPDGVKARLPDEFERQASEERWEDVDWMSAGRWLTRLREEFDVYELAPVLDAGEVVALEASSQTLGVETVRLRTGPRWPMLQALADLWFLFGQRKVKKAAALSTL